MKALFVASVLIALCLADIELPPTPTPIPMNNLNLSTVLGTWYFTMIYDYNINNTQPSEIICQKINYTYHSTIANRINYQETFYSLNINTTNAGYFTILNANNTLWQSNNAGQFYWLEMNPISNDWALLGSTTSQWALALSRYPGLGIFAFRTIYDLLLLEGYNINGSNYYLINNQC